MVAPNRQDRPLDADPVAPGGGACPFCPGSGKVPESYDVLAYDNDYPALARSNDAGTLQVDRPPGLYAVAPAYGKCEVLLYSPDHEAALSGLPLDHVRSLVDLWAERTRELAEDPKINYIMVFENRGAEVGVTIHHPHGQVYAYPFVPLKIQAELDNCRDYFARSDHCLICDMNVEEARTGLRMIAENEEFLCYLPHFTDYPYGAFIVPKRHVTMLTGLTGAERASLAEMLKGLVGAFDLLFRRQFPYMMCVHQGPVNTPRSRDTAEHYHLHIEFYPPLRDATRVKYYASSEMGAWAACNPARVEDTAAQLRDAYLEFARLHSMQRPDSGTSLALVDKARLAAEFERRYGGDASDLAFFFAPGRVNLIGEHTDYNGGFVLPAAISLGIRAAVRYTGERVIRLRSLDRPGDCEVSLERDILFDPRDGWANYPKGVVRHLLNDRHQVPGCDILYSGDLPVGAGLSSSAAIEVLTGFALLCPALGDGIDRVRLAIDCQAAENHFVGVGCGIMDQFTVAMGKPGTAILLDCASLRHEYIPAELGEYRLVIMDTGKSRDLGTSAYKERQDECRLALEMVRRHRDVDNLCGATLEDVRFITGDLLQARARHVISENLRTVEAARLLARGDIPGFGRLMVESHASLRDDFQVTGPELDAIVEEALAQPACLGARMTGAGFGGCAIALVEAARLGEFSERVSAGYRGRTGLDPAIHVSTIGGGVASL